MTATRDPDFLPADEGLNETERTILAAASAGILVDLCSGDSAVDDLANVAEWGDDRNVRAEFLADLLTGNQPVGAGHLRSVKIRGARITGALDLEACKLLCPLLLQDCYFDKPVGLDEAEAVSIRLPYCHIPNLEASQLRTSGSVELNGLTTSGRVCLLGARIGGQLDLSKATLTNRAGSALAADGLTVEQSMFCRNGFTANGRVRMLSARIGGQLDFSGAVLSNSDGWALAADFLTVGESMHCKNVTAHGEVRMLSTRIGGQLSFSGARISNGNGPALNADRLTVSQGIFCRDGFTAHGEIRLLGARIGGQFDLSGASVCNRNGPALNADGLTVSQGMFCRDGFTAHGGMVLANARVGELIDDEASWPDVLYLQGFVYDRLGNASVSARLHWLQRSPGRFTPGIYDQLADVYRRTGDDSPARKVLVAKQRRRRKPYNPLSWLWWVTVGYGYRTWQAFIWAAVFTVVGSLVFSSAYPAHMTAMSAHPTRFQPVIYTLDVLLPIGGLGQKSAWQPATAGLLDWYWALTIAGWVLSAAVLAGLTGILKRD